MQSLQQTLLQTQQHPFQMQTNRGLLKRKLLELAVLSRMHRYPQTRKQTRTNQGFQQQSRLHSL